jgi:hypothetical protein
MRASRKDFMDLAERCRYLNCISGLTLLQYRDLVETMAGFLAVCHNFDEDKFKQFCYFTKIKGD